MVIFLGGEMFDQTGGFTFDGNLTDEIMGQGEPQVGIGVSFDKGCGGLISVNIKEE